VIAERHHGTIELSSEVGKGTTFTIRLPLREREA
jgi:signal transduction histidine kinase